jgi:DNA-binding NtrC family response regulator
MKPKSFCILVVDRDPLIREGLEQLFGPERVSFYFCEQLADAIKAMKSDRFDCAIVDIQIEGTNRQAAPILQALDPALPIILTAEKNTRALEIGAYRQHAFYYFVKPFGVEELRLAVLQALKKSNPDGLLPA